MRLHHRGDDHTKSDVSCILADANGQKYEDRPDMRVDIKIKLGDQLITYILQEASEVSSFTFNAFKVDVDKIQINVTIVDSNEKDNVSHKSYSKLRNVMKWEIVEPPEPKDLDLAIKRQINAGLLWTSWRWTKGDEKDHKNHAGRATWLNAVETCDQLSTFDRKWSLPTVDQIKTAANDSIHSWLKDRYTNSPDRLWSKDEGLREDGTITKKIVALPEGQIDDLLPVHDIYFSCVAVLN